MAEQLGDLTRTHTCGALRTDNVGTDVVLLGWVHRVRDLGGVLFIDVRDRGGVTQVVFDKDDEALMTKAKRLRSEYVVGIAGNDVAFRVRADPTGGKKRTLRIPGTQFIGRFLQHVLPAGFKRIRHYGLLSPARKKTGLPAARAALGVPPPEPAVIESVAGRFCAGWRASSMRAARTAGLGAFWSRE